MSSLRVMAFLALAILGACTSTVQNTPRQDLIWSAYNQCKAAGRAQSNIQLTRVDPDGQVWYEANRSAYGAAELERCINEKVSPPPTYVPTVNR